MIKTYLKTRKLNIVFSSLAIILMWVIWLIAYYSVKNEYIIPSVSDTLESLGHIFISRNFWTACAYTVLRTALAFVISFALAAALVVACIVYKPLVSFIKPITEVLRTLPTLSIVLILLLWPHGRSTAPVIVTGLVLFPMIFSQLAVSFAEIDSGITEMATVYSVSKRDRLFKIYLPMMSPAIVSQTGANISLGIKVMISAEVLASTARSLGGMMQDARMYTEMPRLAALTIVAVILGLVIDFAFSLIQRFSFKWNRKGEL